MAATPRKHPTQSTLRLPSRSARTRTLSRDALPELLSAALWPLVSTAFRGVADDVEACFFQLDELQVIVSRPPLRDSAHRHDADRRVTMEVWPAVGPRLLQVEWNGRRPYVIHRREGDWLAQLIDAARTLA